MSSRTTIRTVAVTIVFQQNMDVDPDDPVSRDQLIELGEALKSAIEQTLPDAEVGGMSLRGSDGTGSDTELMLAMMTAEGAVRQAARGKAGARDSRVFFAKLDGKPDPKMN